MKTENLYRIVKTVLIAGLILPPILVGAILFLSPSITPEEASRIIYGNTTGVPQITFTLTEQIAIFIAAFIIKPLYQIIALIVVIFLWKRTDAELSAIRCAMLAFFLGENACALNYFLFDERSLLMEFFHTYGMVVCFGLVCYALTEAFDKQVFNFSNKEKKCVLLPLCKKCYKYQAVSCNLRILFLFVIPATAVLTAIPLTALVGSHFVSGNVFGHPVIFGHSISYQLMEIRFYPIISLVFFVLSFFFVYFQKEDGFETSKVFYSMGVGPLGFSLLRFFLYWGYQQNPLWADVWEEITEFLFIAFILWLSLRIRAVTRQCDEKLPEINYNTGR